MTKSQKFPTTRQTAVNGLWLQWSPANMAWLVRWMDSEVLAVESEKANAIAVAEDFLGRKF